MIVTCCWLLLKRWPKDRPVDELQLHVDAEVLLELGLDELADDPVRVRGREEEGNGREAGAVLVTGISQALFRVRHVVLEAFCGAGVVAGHAGAGSSSSPVGRPPGARLR